MKLTKNCKKILDKVNNDLKNMKVVHDGKDHIEDQKRFRAVIYTNKKKVIDRKKKYKEVY